MSRAITAATVALTLTLAACGQPDMAASQSAAQQTAAPIAYFLTPAPEPPLNPSYIVADGILYSAPNNVAQGNTRLLAGTPIEVRAIAPGGTWYQVTANNTTGWIPASSIAIDIRRVALLPIVER